jgi:hypothetical protein
LKWIAVSALLVHGCSAVQLPEYTIQPFDNYEYKEIKEGLAIAIVPFTSREGVEKQFGANLLFEGILPVLIFVENRSPKSSYILFKDRVWLTPGLLLPDGTSVRERLTSDRIAQALTFGAFVGLAAGFAVPGPALLALPLGFASDKMKADADEIKYNLAIKELHTRTVSPERSVSGFAYFKMPEKGIATPTWTVRIDVLDLQSKRSLTFDIPFKLQWDGK